MRCRLGHKTVAVIMGWLCGGVPLYTVLLHTEMSFKRFIAPPTPPNLDFEPSLVLLSGQKEMAMYNLLQWSPTIKNIVRYL